jgi:hypothetical protein
MKKFAVIILAVALCAAIFVPTTLVSAQNSDRAQNNSEKVMPPGKPSSPKLKAKFRKAPSDKKAHNQYIVVLAEEVEDVEQEAERLIVGHGGSRHNQHTYRRALKGFSVWTTEGAARKMAEDPRVEFVEEDRS